MYVILLRNPTSGAITALTEDGDNLATWATKKEAQEMADGHILCVAWPHLIVEAP